MANKQTLSADGLSMRVLTFCFGAASVLLIVTGLLLALVAVTGSTDVSNIWLLVALLLGGGLALYAVTLALFKRVFAPARAVESQDADKA